MMPSVTVEHFTPISPAQASKQRTASYSRWFQPRENPGSDCSETHGSGSTGPRKMPRTFSGLMDSPITLRVTRTVGQLIRACSWTDPAMLSILFSVTPVSLLFLLLYKRIWCVFTTEVKGVVFSPLRIIAHACVPGVLVRQQIMKLQVSSHASVFDPAVQSAVLTRVRNVLFFYI